MISTFADKTTLDIYQGLDTKAARKIPKNVWATAQRRFDQMRFVTDINEFRDPPGNHFEALKGKLAGFFSVRLNSQFRIIFHFSAGVASDVQIIDYHY